MSKTFVKLTSNTGSFAKLQLQRDPQTGDLTFSQSAIEQLCADNGIDAAQILSSEDNTSGLIVAWYAAHIAAGGEPDGVAEDLLSEVRAEDEFGGGQSYQPGRA